ncbi:type VI secretion system baseplate subunit TssG [Methylobacterium sp. J-090]|uniref:type VI secretion system baseplate subunit TssG n=1 Tax=Methylobacterium sp. J-090 TaxID=2836666 RepID=UPI001FBA3C92|nr:type VI secretion system baseplate subunit TssG [Methylobacterium sp. J-090]MCJ2081718.1 type VI secretion system baseplate subunit TssG [Methylobacterium sp. J-090]
MTFRRDIQAAPWAFDLLAALRRIERSFPDKPRIGDSAARRDDYVALGEDPYLAFPVATIGRADEDAQGRLRLFVKFLGLLGPQGPLPLSVTDEAHGWFLARDDAFARFLDILNHRFLQLFYRAWADARPIAQAEIPQSDRFTAYLGAFVGLGSPCLRDRDSVPDAAKLAYAGLLAPAARSASRLRNALTGLLGVAVEVEEFVGSRLEFEPGDRSRLGRANVRLGADLLLGSSVFSVDDKIRLRITAANLPGYERLLPGGEHCRPLADLIFFYLGDELDCDVELALPVAAVAPVSLGRFGRLGYTSWIGPAAPGAGDGFRRDARFHPAERAARPDAPPSPHTGRPQA